MTTILDRAPQTLPRRSETVELAGIFKLLGDPSRLRIVLSCLRRPVSVNQIASALDLSQSSVSHHLRLLRVAHVVRSERRGKWVFYRVADDHVRWMLNDMVEYMSEITVKAGPRDT